jgi:hypothetical protein
MKSKLVLTILTVLTLVLTMAGTASIASAGTGCDPAHVQRSGNVIVVQPNGVDDTANLQCAFDVALTVGAGAQVRLSPGVFHTAQVVVNDFDGSFTGAGADATVIANIPNLYVTPVDFYIDPPSATKPWPSLFSFVNGNIAISDLAIKVSGDNPTMGWTIFGIDPPLKELTLAIVIVGTEAHVRVERVLIEGETMANSLYGYNLINGIYFEGNIGELPCPPLSGSFEVYNSTFRHLASPAPVYNLENATVIISHNRFEDVFDGADATDLVNSSVSITHNQVDGALFGFWFYPGWSINVGSKILLKNNVFHSTYGMILEGVFGEGNQCLILGNNVQDVTDIGVYLGADVTGCTVVGGKSKTNVLDLGTGNIVVGVNNMGAGVGPTISDFIGRKRP